MYFQVSLLILHALTGAIINIDPNYEAAIEFVTLILAAVVIIVAAGKLITLSPRVYSPSASGT